MFEHFLSYIAPHSCISCGVEGALLCTFCIQQLPPASTWNAQLPNVAQSQTMSSTTYACDTVQRLVHAVKFERAKSAAKVMAQSMHQRLPDLPQGVIITHVPTANVRVRQRGYDQAALVAKEFARYRRRPWCTLLARKTVSRQLGASASARHEQVRGSLRCINVPLPAKKPIILIDDVVTTGATMQEAARILTAHDLRLYAAYSFAYVPPK